MRRIKIACFILSVCRDMENLSPQNYPFVQNSCMLLDFSLLFLAFLFDLMEHVTVSSSKEIDGHLIVEVTLGYVVILVAELEISTFSGSGFMSTRQDSFCTKS